MIFTVEAEVEAQGVALDFVARKIEPKFGQIELFVLVFGKALMY